MRLAAHLGWVHVTCASRVFWRHLRCIDAGRAGGSE
jgi:hypothetical protein